MKENQEEQVNRQSKEKYENVTRRELRVTGKQTIQRKRYKC